jgi:LPXTG-motif cell wall-anchored protein
VRTTVAGGGRRGAGQLPRTGAPVWLAAVIGLVLLAAGLWTQLNAVRIGATAMLYRRGPALRPIASSRMLADRLAELVDTPAPASDFTTTRVRRGPR